MLRTTIVALALAVLVSAVTAEVYFDEDFSNKDWKQRWVESTHKGDSAGEWKLAGETGGLQTSEDARFYQISAKLNKDFSNKGKNLVLQYSVQHPQSIDCGGSYIKLLPSGLDQTDFNGDSEYALMFGPDICGGSTRKVHVIFNYKGKNHLINKNIPCQTDVHTHLYTLIVKPDQTWTVLVDNVEEDSGDFGDWDFLPPKQIKDPKANKPSDWVDDAEIDDASDVKPAGWDDIPSSIVDPDAEKPDDWDDELDGEWEAATIPNPEFQGVWRPKKIPNPAYNGPWVHPLVDNPDYAPDASIYAYPSLQYLGIEVWQVKSGTIFDHFLVTDDIQLASDRAAVIVTAAKAAKAQQEAKQEAEAAAARATAEAEAAASQDDDDENN